MPRPEIHRLDREELRQLLAFDTGLPSEITDEMAIPTYRHRNPLIRWLFWRRYLQIAQLADLRPDVDVLEFGCGIGVFLPTLVANARKVFACDLYPQYARELARRKRLSVVFLDDLEALDDGAVDLIIAADVLEHIEDLAGVLAVFRRKLGSGGRLVISGPTESRLYRLGRILAGFAGKGGYHVSNIELLREDVQRHGFEQRRIRSLPFAVPPHLFRVIEFQVES